MTEFRLKRDRLLIWQRVMPVSELAVRGLKVALPILSGVPCRASTMPGRKKQRTHTNTCEARNKEPSQPHTHSHINTRGHVRAHTATKSLLKLLSSQTGAFFFSRRILHQSEGRTDRHTMQTGASERVCVQLSPL